MRITLPQLDITYLKRNRNVVCQLICPKREIEANVRMSTEAGVSGFIIEELNIGQTVQQNNLILVVKKGRNIPDGYKNIIQLNKLPSALQADISDGIWIKHSEKERFQNNQNIIPDIIQSWDSSFRYIEENPSQNIEGLRLPQIGALHAIQSHWTVSDEPATIVMPTGTGKTETMLSTLVSCKCSKRLVIVPTDALRGQKSQKF
jgi:hypothetical protein